MNSINSPDAPIPIGPYSQAIEAGGVIYSSGAIGINPETSALVDGGVEEQTVQALKNLQAILDAAGSGLKNVIRTTVMLKDMGDFAAFNLVYEKIMTEAKGTDSPMPARTTFAVAGLPKNALVEIDCIAQQVTRQRPKAAKEGV